MPDLRTRAGWLQIYRQLQDLQPAARYVFPDTVDTFKLNNAASASHLASKEEITTAGIDGGGMEEEEEEEDVFLHPRSALHKVCVPSWGCAVCYPSPCLQATPQQYIFC